MQGSFKPTIKMSVETRGRKSLVLSNEQKAERMDRMREKRKIAYHKKVEKKAEAEKEKKTAKSGGIYDFSTGDWYVVYFEDVQTQFRCPISPSTIDIDEKLLIDYYFESKTVNDDNCVIPFGAGGYLNQGEEPEFTNCEHCNMQIRYVFEVSNPEHSNVRIGTTCVTKVDDGWGQQAQTIRNKYLGNLNRLGRKVKLMRQKQAKRVEEIRAWEEKKKEKDEMKRRRAEEDYVFNKHIEECREELISKFPEWNSRGLTISEIIKEHPDLVDGEDYFGDIIDLFKKVRNDHLNKLANQAKIK